MKLKILRMKSKVKVLFGISKGISYFWNCLKNMELIIIKR